MNNDSRRLVFIVMFAIVGIVYTLRLFYMQVIDDRWIGRAAEVSQKRVDIKPPRGILLDRNGKKIVSNKTYYNLMFTEDKIKDFDTVAFARLLKMELEQIRERFEEIRKSLDRKTRDKKTGNDTIVNDYRSYLPYAFLRELTAEEISEIAIEIGNFPGFYEEPVSMRNYPYPNGGNIFGYLNEIRPHELDADRYFYKMGDFIGRAGLERYYEKQLRGRKGTRFILTSARGKVVDNYAGGRLDTIAVQGPPLHLGMDIELQAYGEELMKNKLGCIVAIEPQTGQILAMVSSPSYDPNMLVGSRNIKKNYNILVTDSLKPMFPRPLQAEYPPGSIFKLVQALIGMQEGVITENSGFPCTKSMVGCHGHPTASTIQQSVQYSCNPYYYYVMRRIIHQGKKRNAFQDAEVGMEIWEKYMHSFGLGVQLETDIYGMRPGVIPNVAFYDRWYGKHRWQWSTIRSISIGQGEVKITPLQMANIAVIMANGGWYYTPHFVQSIGDDGPLPEFRERHYSMVDSKYYPIVQEGMRRVVNEGGGTAGRARIKDIVVAGKTGTAQNPHGKDHSVFIAYAPFDNPKIAISVFIENAGFGGTWAAPIASLMIEKYLKGEISDLEKEKRILEANLIFK
jgi:penicillin-binding protein 2